MTEAARDSRPLVSAGLLIGMGMGGFVDGIVFHQILQLHGMLSARYPKTGIDPATALVNVEFNMFWDGVFHAFCWIAAALGTALLWRTTRVAGTDQPTRVLWGSLALGWGLFNLVEGLIDHQLMGIHHVVEAGPHLPWDLAFLASGVVLMLAGWKLIAARTPGHDPVA